MLIGNHSCVSIHVSLFYSFFTRANPWFPFLDGTAWIDEHLNGFDFDTPTLTATSENCTVLLIAALGSLAEDQTIGAPQSAKCKECVYMLSAVIDGNNLISVQCLILFCIYYLWVVDPPQAFKCIGMASDKIQDILSAYLPFQPD